MIIKKIFIKKFRGFQDVEFELGKFITVISGQNGTQKTTILGMLSQSFAITDDDHPMKNEKPLSGGNYISSFADKFKLSEAFDKPGEHEWTLFFENDIFPPYEVESIHRDKSKGTLRFWKKNDRTKGSGFIQLPVIYLSLKRLLPIAEDIKLSVNEKMSLSTDDFIFYKKWFNKILILTREKDQVQSSNYLSSTNKQTLGANTDHYDWKSNSAGQDNLSKILLSILSFKKLQEKYTENYIGGILAIDEIDASFYPGSQKILFEELITFASKYKIQIIFTTHSLTILEKVNEIQAEPNRAGQVKLMFLTKEDGRIKVKNDTSYSYIHNHLNRTLTGNSKTRKIDIYTEDKEGTIFVKSLIGQKTKYLNFINVSLGCGNIIQLASVKVPSFTYPNSIIVLDGDVKRNSSQLRAIKKIKNILLLPTDKSPEQFLSDFLYTLKDTNPIWKEIDETFDHQFCFQQYSNAEIQTDREKAKKWFNSHLLIWGKNASKVLNLWKKEHKELVSKFNGDFDKLLDNIL
ncbi:AAA family ATPase [Aquirufa nivalisilvae]